MTSSSSRSRRSSAKGLAGNEHVIAIATAPHWNAITARLDESGIEYGRAATAGQLVLIEAEEALDAVTVNGTVSVERFGTTLARSIKSQTKTRIYGELVSLLAHAETSRLRSQLSASVTNSRVPRVSGCTLGHGQFHAVRFYESRQSLAGMVGQFLGEGFVAGLPSVVIATPEHVGAIRGVLTTRFFDVARLEAAGDLTNGKTEVGDLWKIALCRLVVKRVDGALFGNGLVATVPDNRAHRPT